MTRNQERCLWSTVLSAFGAQRVEQLVCNHLRSLQDQGEFSGLHDLVSAEGIAELAGILLTNIETGERPLLGLHCTMNPVHFRVLRQVRRPLSLLLLADLPIDFVPAELRRLRIQLDLSI